MPYVNRKQRLQVRSIAKRLKQSNTTIGLDRDGVINKEPTKLSARDLAKIGLERPSKYVDKTGHFLFEPRAKQALRRLHDNGFRIFLATGKAGVGRGHQTMDEVKAQHKFMQQQVSTNKRNPVIGDIYAATYGASTQEPDNPEKQNKFDVGFDPEILAQNPQLMRRDCGNGRGYARTIFLMGPDAKKPNTAMFKVAQAKLGFEPSKTFYVGDEESDLKAARNFGCPSIFIGPKEKWVPLYAKYNHDPRNPTSRGVPLVYFARNLSEASKIALEVALGKRKVRTRR